MTSEAYTPGGPAVAAPRHRYPLSARRALGAIAFVAVLGLAAVLVAPQVAVLGEAWRRLGEGELGWLLLAVALEAVALAGYVTLFHGVAGRGIARIRWRESYEINLAALVAARVFGAAGAGGVALTAWALRRAGLEAREVARRMVSFIVILYAVYMLSLVVGGFGLASGVFAGGGSWALTLLPAAIASAAIAMALALGFAPGPHRVAALAPRRRVRRWLAVSARSAREGITSSVALVRAREPALLAAPLAWYADIAVLWASFQAFGEAPALAVLVTAYFVGMVANTLPLPGGIGGADAGLIAAFIGFGIDPALALVSVLVYRAIAYWLPTVPGALAYGPLHRTVEGWRREDARAQGVRAGTL